jgi:methionine--tRNA ligase beta chain
MGAAAVLSSMLAPIRAAWDADPELAELALAAYPPPRPRVQDAEWARLDLRVGRVLECAPHPERATLLVSRVDLGPAAHGGARTIVSGLAAWYKPEAMVGRLVLVLCNVKASKFAGVLSEGMLVAGASPAPSDAAADGAARPEPERVELLEPGEDAVVGESVVLEGYEAGPVPGAVLKPKHKVFEKVAARMHITPEGSVAYDGAEGGAGDVALLRTASGVVRLATLRAGTIS